MHTHIHEYARACARARSLSSPPIRMHARTHAHTQARIRVRTHAHTHTHTHTHTHRDAHTRSLSLPLALSLTVTHTHTHTCTHTQTKMTVKELNKLELQMLKALNICCHVSDAEYRDVQDSCQMKAALDRDWSRVRHARPWEWGCGDRSNHSKGACFRKQDYAGQFVACKLASNVP